MRKVFILLFISLALLSCQKEENNRKTEYQVLTSKDASKPFSCLGEKRIITITIIKKTLIDDVLSSEVPIIPRDVSVEFDKTLFYLQTLEEGFEHAPKFPFFFPRDAPDSFLQRG